MNCKKCQAQLNPEARFCSQCGEKVEEENQIQKICYDYFSLGLVLGMTRNNKKIRNSFIKKAKEMNSKLGEIYENPLVYLYPEEWEKIKLELEEKKKLIKVNKKS